MLKDNKPWSREDVWLFEGTKQEAWTTCGAQQRASVALARSAWNSLELGEKNKKKVQQKMILVWLENRWMHSGRNWTHTRKLKADDEPQIITKSEEKQLNIWKLLPVPSLMIFCHLLRQWEVQMSIREGQSKQPASAQLPDYNRLFIYGPPGCTSWPPSEGKPTLKCQLLVIRGNFLPLLHYYTLKWILRVCLDARVSLLGTDILAGPCERAGLSLIHTLTSAGGVWSLHVAWK